MIVPAPSRNEAAKDGCWDMAVTLPVCRPQAPDALPRFTLDDAPRTKWP